MLLAEKVVGAVGDSRHLPNRTRLRIAALPPVALQ